MASQKPTAEERQKRNTDCVYFLASPLTCKKGSDCEYRHSETARVNPRDCWFWLGGNCLNQHCAFRHPPLDGRPPTCSTPLATSTKKGPCFFFSQGFCAKGDKCAFMHGQSSTPSVEMTPQTSLKKVNRSTELIEKQVSVSKGNGLISPMPLPKPLEDVHTVPEIKPASYSGAQAVHAKAVQAPQVAVVMPNDTARVWAPEGSGSSEPTGSYGCQIPLGEKRLKQAPLVEGRVNKVQSIDKIFGQALSGGDRLCRVQSEVQSVDNWLQQVQLIGGRMQNGVELEEWREESSPAFDVPADNGSNQPVYLEDGECLSHHDAAMESGRSCGHKRFMDPCDMTELEYDQSGGAYDESRYYDTAGQYNHACFGPYEEKHGHYRGKTYDHMGRQQAPVYGDRVVGKVLASEKRGNAMDMRQGSSGIDLRNLISKRRRLDRGQQLAEDNQQKRTQKLLASEYRHSNIRRNDHPGRQEVLTWHQGTLSNHSRSHGRVEPSGSKQVYLNSDYEISPERISMKNSSSKLNLGDHVRTKAREREWGQTISEAAIVPGFSSSNSRRVETRKDDTDFARPKSLAQIKAEKGKANGGERLEARDMHDEHLSALHSMPHGNYTFERSVSNMKSQISPAPSSLMDTVYKEATVGEEGEVGLVKVPIHESIKPVGFKRPRSFSSNLEAKQNIEFDRETMPEEVKNKQAPKISPSRPIGAFSAGSMAGSFVSSVIISERVLEHTQGCDSLSATNLPQLNGNVRMLKEDTVSDMDDTLLFKYGHAPALTSDIIVKERVGNLQVNRQSVSLSSKIAIPKDSEDGAEPGENATEDGEFELDGDEDDDFAKKLGGFFS